MYTRMHMKHMLLNSEKNPQISSFDFLELRITV